MVIEHSRVVFNFLRPIRPRKKMQAGFESESFSPALQKTERLPPIKVIKVMFS